MPDKHKPDRGELEAHVVEAAAFIDEQKVENIVVLDLRGVCDFTDVFIIATTRSNTHMRGLMKNLAEKLKGSGLQLLAKPDPTSARWSLLDFGEIDVHFFDADSRAYYDLETLWADADQLPWQEMAMA